MTGEVRSSHPTHCVYYSTRPAHESFLANLLPLVDLRLARLPLGHRRKHADRHRVASSLIGQVAHLVRCGRFRASVGAKATSPPYGLTAASSSEAAVPLTLGRTEQSVHVHIDAWVDAEHLHDDQCVLADDGEPGARLGDGWLLAAPLRRIHAVERLLYLMRWSPGMPETLAAPQGRA
jgi:hypothetical protein